MSDTIYTIGHSTHSIEHIISLLKKSSITAVCDVRSKPYSRTNPQFNRDVISIALRNAGIVYVFLGEELGARTHDKNCYCDGQVQYDRLAKTDFFERGLRRVRDGARSYRLALMCAEKEPLECHRTILVSRSLVERGMCVRHILSDGRLEEHEQTLERLIQMLKIPTDDMFRSKSEIISEAYRIQGKAIAYTEKPTTPNSYDQIPLTPVTGASS